MIGQEFGCITRVELHFCSSGFNAGTEGSAENRPEGGLVNQLPCTEAWPELPSLWHSTSSECLVLNAEELSVE